MSALAVIFHRLGPYHHARLHAASQLIDITAIETCAMDNTYDWVEVKGAQGFQRVTLFSSDAQQKAASEVGRRIRRALDKAKPAVVAIPGWSAREALAALDWCRSRRRPAIIMSASTAHDKSRTWWKEAIKTRIVKLCAAGIVGGQPHADYMARLGMPRDCIFSGYDVVDNDYFAREADAVRRTAKEVRLRLGMPRRCFLASGRFVRKKNFGFLIEAYYSYQRHAGAKAWDLIILGDGALRRNLEQQRDQLGLTSRIHLPGFKQYDELPAWYGLAGAFVHTSTTEQWGLVVNEAMAAGLPVLVSNRCGCAPDLVEEGRNGFVFDPTDVAALARSMLRMSDSEIDLIAMGKASRAIISRWTPHTFATNLNFAANSAIERVTERTGFTDRVMLRLLSAS